MRGAARADAGTVLGSTTPRLFTRPLVTGAPGPCGCGCALAPETSRGFEFAEFCETVLREPLTPWQRWLGIHMLEVTPAGRYRFRTVLVLVARQQGKTFFARSFALWKLYLDGAALVLSVAQSLDIAREAWRAGCEAIGETPSLQAEHVRTSRVNGDEWVGLEGGRRWKIAASNRGAGRGLSVDLLLMDELREQRTWAAWSALSKTTAARRDSLILAISNAGDDESVVLNHLREQGLAGEDETLGLFEWSAPDRCDLDDPQAWAAACPSLGHTDFTEASVRAALATDPPVVFRTELLCQRVKSLDPAIDPDAWQRCLDLGDMNDVRSRVALCLDVSLDAQHATVCAAAVLDDGRVRVEPVGDWTGPNCTLELVNALPALVARVKPRALGWFPKGPAAAVSVDLRKRRGWPPRGVQLAPISGETADVCMGFGGAVDAGLIAHSAEALLNAHVAVAERLRSGDRWTFTRKGGGHVDALYAAAGAAHLARSLPRRVSGEPGARKRVITSRD